MSNVTLTDCGYHFIAGGCVHLISRPQFILGIRLNISFCLRTNASDCNLRLNIMIWILWAVRNKMQITSPGNIIFRQGCPHSQRCWNIWPGNICVQPDILCIKFHILKLITSRYYEMFMLLESWRREGIQLRNIWWQIYTRDLLDYIKRESEG